MFHWLIIKLAMVFKDKDVMWDTPLVFQCMNMSGVHDKIYELKRDWVHGRKISWLMLILPLSKKKMKSQQSKFMHGLMNSVVVWGCFRKKVHISNEKLIHWQSQCSCMFWHERKQWYTFKIDIWRMYNSW